MAKLDTTLGQALFFDTFGHEPSANNAPSVKALQHTAFSMLALDAMHDWARLVQEQGGIFVDQNSFIYPDWTGGALMDAKV